MTEFIISIANLYVKSHKYAYIYLYTQDIVILHSISSAILLMLYHKKNPR